MFVKFNENGQVVSFSQAVQLEDIVPDATDFEPLASNFSIDDIAFIKKMNGQIFLDETLKNRAMQRHDTEKQIVSLTTWFNLFYSPQLEQVQRAMRTGTAWYASDGAKEYTTLAELDTEANNKQNQIRAFRQQK